MKLNNRSIGLLTCVLVLGISLSGCGSSDPEQPQLPTGRPNGVTIPVVTGRNVMALTVNGANCSNSYSNKPCVSVQVCAPGTSNCQVISDILLDTGSYGLRVFKSAMIPSLSAALTPVASGSKSLAECVQFGDGSKDWGPVERADVILGAEPAVTVPIQVIDSTFANSSAYCSGADTSPAAAGFNGLLGVGFLKQDCGSTCTTQAGNSLYYACNGPTCNGATVPLSNQVQNPVPSLATDNNGIILEFPLIPFGGQRSLEGYLVLGIGTAANNSPSGVITYPANPTTGEITTHFGNQSYDSFLDSGSNGIFFPGGLPDCGNANSSYSGWYCPSSTLSLNAMIMGAGGIPNNGVLFQVGNIINLMSTGNRVFMELGGNAGGNIFDWGLPFYVGRNTYLGFMNRTSSLGTGPFWAF